MSLLVGAAEADITPTYPGGPLGYVRRLLAARSAYEQLWAARIGDCAIVGAPGEIFGAIGTAVRRLSPAAVTIFAGYSQGSLGYVATPQEYAPGGYEPAVSHRGYGQPAPFAPDVAGIIERTAVDLVRDLFG